MTIHMAIHTRSNKPSANSEVHSTNDEILIPVSTNIPIVPSASSPVSLKTPTKIQLSSTDMTYIQHQIDRLRQQMEKNAAENNEIKNLIKKALSEEKIHKRDEAEILYEKFTILQKEKQCLKSEVKNQQVVIEMLITGDRCGNEWKVVKNDKIKTNTNKTSASSIPSKVLSPVHLQNRFSSLRVTEESSIENESQTPTNYNQRIEIQNTKYKSRVEKIKSHSI